MASNEVDTTFRIPLQCSKGCGQPVMTSMEAVQEAASLGVPLVVAHEECPAAESSATKVGTYRVTIRVDYMRAVEGGEPEVIQLAQVGKSLEGRSFAAVADAMSKELTLQWSLVLANKDILDSDVG